MCWNNNQLFLYYTSFDEDLLNSTLDSLKECGQINLLDVSISDLAPSWESNPNSGYSTTHIGSHQSTDLQLYIRILLFDSLMYLLSRKPFSFTQSTFIDPINFWINSVRHGGGIKETPPQIFLTDIHHCQLVYKLLAIVSVELMRHISTARFIIRFLSAANKRNNFAGEFSMGYTRLYRWTKR